LFVIGVYNDDSEGIVMTALGSLVSNLATSSGVNIVYTSHRFQDLSTDDPLRELWRSRNGYVVTSPPNTDVPNAYEFVVCEATVNGGASIVTRTGILLALLFAAIASL
jgi:hypothetical protein